MGNYAVPKEIRELKPKGTMVKLIHNKYYVYEYHSVKKDNKWITKTDKLIGHIDPKLGFISNQNIHKDNITTVDFGEYYLVYGLSKNILDKLITIFNIKDAYEIYIVSLINFIHGFTYLKNIDTIYKQSYLSVKFSSINLSDNIISKLYDNLGRRQDKVNLFEELLIKESSKELAIDGHSIKSSCNYNDLTEKGNKLNIFKNNQINVLMAYDINSNYPVLSRIYSGGTLDKISFKDLIERKDLNSLLFIIDKGFYSKENIKLLEEKNNKYIIPLYANHKAYKEVINLNVSLNTFIYTKNRKRTTIEYKSMIINNKKVIFYRDLTQSALESSDYVSKIGVSDNYTIDKYNKLKDEFGTIIIETNVLDKTEEEIFNLYKERWSIETFFDYYKNHLDVNSLHLNDYYKTQGLSFIMLIASLIHAEFIKALKSQNIKESYSTILLEAKYLKLHKNNKGIWNVENINKKHSDIFTKYNLNLIEESNSL